MRSLSSVRRQPFSIPPREPILPQNEIVDEEVCPGYDSKKFYPANPGEVLANRYQILVKVGWGTTSTVWLARDMRGQDEEPESVVALKITNTDSSQHVAHDEREIEEHIAKTDPSHRGYPLFRTCSKFFEITGPEGRHLCLAYEPMREPFWVFQRRFEGGVIPLPIVKTYILFLLAGLDYLHTGCGIVLLSPTKLGDFADDRLMCLLDLKLENIMVTFEHPAVLGDFMNCQLDQPAQCKIDSTGRPIYRSHKEFGPLRTSRNILPKIVDFGGSTRFHCQDEGAYILYNQITIARLRLSLALWDIIQGKELFSQVHDLQGNYQAKAHLAEMIALLGNPPQDLITRSHSMSGYQWPECVKNVEGVTCENAEKYFGGPFFDHNGKFLYEELIPDRKLTDILPLLEEKEKENFLSFAKMMLAWLPEERKTARELMEHPFLRRPTKTSR
ncbi:uncharacterized protein N7498_004249 [Penicillium cinerascens]|uniref:non-specific serine/threonine protein kinase n=1 Tax=Penicillium cinerascens TaxID=70096 RepID=A0A9W9N4N1_9EURO|nr:uncharacterized protein N7498_004249 [Penicillium cinerascens]KAJ5212603.1 hypothetical protein N7498_004249 [Penicillium cinerascens]